MSATLPRSLAVALAVTLLVSGCGTAAVRQSAEPNGAAIEAAPMTDDRTEADTTAPEINAIATRSTDVDEFRERCLDTIALLDRRIEDEDFHYPEEEEELTEEELEQSMAPEVAFVDGVAAPDDRPAIEAMADFDAMTMPILQLDRVRDSCFEHGLVTEAEVYPDDDEDWCDELAGFPVEEVRAFAADEGEDVVREAFEECDLPNPLDR